MAENHQETNSVYRSAYRGTRDALRSALSRLGLGLLLALLGLVGVGLLAMTGLAVLEGTATVRTVPAAVVGLGTLAFTSVELTRL